MPLSPRPLSIFSALKARQSKQNVGANAQPLVISAPISTASSVAIVDAMPPSNMDRTGRLLAYAKAGSTSGIPPPTNPVPPAPQAPRQESSQPQQQQQLRRADTPAVVPQAPPPPAPATAPLTPRQALAQQAKIPIPSKATATKTLQYPGSPPRPQHHHLRQGSASSLGSHHQVGSPPHASPPMRRARTNSDSRQQAGEGGLWDSTIDSSSMGDWETRSRGATLVAPPPNGDNVNLEATRLWAQNSGHPAYRGPRQAQPERSASRRSHEFSHGHFVIGENGAIEPVTGLPLGASPKAINTGIQGGLPGEQVASRDKHPADAPFHPAVSAQRTVPPVTKAKLPIRDARLRRSYQDQRTSGYAGEDEMLSSSPTYDSPRHGYRKDDPLDSRRTTEFADLDDHMDDPMLSDESTGASEIEPVKQPATRATKTAKAKPKGLLESSLPLRTGGDEEKSTRKRRRASSGDYKDTALKAMRYEELKAQPFDFDPARPHAEIAVVTPETELYARLQSHRNQGMSAQTAFFTEMSVTDWERAGDWFLEQFSDVTKRLRTARQARRKVVDEFETEIANREELVRIRTQSIREKLGKMKQDGEHMLQDKDI